MQNDPEWLQPLCRDLTAHNIPWQQAAALAPLTTFRIGGPATLLCTPVNTRQLAQLLVLLQQCAVRHYCLGRGSNTLFADEGFDGVVIATSALQGIDIQGNTVTAAAGVPLATLCCAVRDSGLAGLEFAYGIPGAVGGAVYMNAGAYGGEMQDVITAVQALDPYGRSVQLAAAECDFAYRHSAFASNGCTVTGAVFTLRPDSADAITARMLDFAQRRRDKQPLEYPSAGSTFKRPQGAFAAALIDQCGLKGLQVGGAAVSQKHAGFVVNLGGATCADVIALTEQVAAVVKEKTGYTLEREIRVVR